MNAKLDVDATKLFEALKYQIHVAIEYCHTLEKNDVLWIEVFGDVSIAGRDQIEVKDYSDSLSDSHDNFWNTLNNWLNPLFQHQQYANLILLTTQAFGERASLKNWEESNSTERLTILEAIHASGERRFNKAKQAEAATEDDDSKATDGKTKRKLVTASDSLKHQREVMAPEVRVSLLEALPKIKIITEQPDLLELISTYKMRYLKGILPVRQDNFVDDLFGYMTSAVKITGGWKFTVSEFDKKFAELNARYMHGTLKFPSVGSDELEKKAVAVNVANRLFAMKLNEIGINKAAILQAVADLLHAEHYINELIKDPVTSKTDIEAYSNNQLRLHQSSRSGAMRKCSTLSHAAKQEASCAFYDDRCAVDVEKFSTYDFTPVEFRNGIYHILADKEPSSPLKEFHWRLWE